MYASNRIDRDGMRVPLNYSGNAFARAERERPRAEPSPAQDKATAPPVQPEAEVTEKALPQAQEDRRTEPKAATEQTDGKCDGEAAQGEEKAPTSTSLSAAVQGLFRRDGWGQEDMMLMALLLLMRGEEGGAQGELFWLLLLLLFLS